MPTRAQLLHRRALLAAASKRRPAPARPIPRAQLPRPTAYTRALTNVADALNDALAEALTIALSDAPARADAADGDVPDVNRRALDARLQKLAEQVAKRQGGMIDRAAHACAENVTQVTKEQWAKQAKAAVGVDLSDVEPNLTSTIKRFKDEHSGLIKSMAEDKVARLRRLLDDNPNARVETIRDRILAEGDVTKRQAALIARDQVLKLNSAVTQKRHEAAGVTKYIWRTSGDGDVRPAHKALDGKTFTYDDPPVVDRKSGRRCRPGEDYQCRCTMEPVIEGFDEEAAPERTTAEEKPAPRLRYPDPPPPPREKEEDVPERSHRALDNARHADFAAMPIQPRLQGVGPLDHKAATVQYPQNHMHDAAFNDHLVAATEEARASIAPADVTALERYTGPAYGRVNLYLREGEDAVKKRYGAKAVAGLQSVAEGTTKALAKLPRAPSDMVLFRGATFDDVAHLDALASGSEFTSKAFLSTSRDPGVAMGFGGGFGSDPSVLYRIRKHSSGAILSPEISDGAEAEVLFPPGARFRIIGRQRVSETQLVVDLEELV